MSDFKTLDGALELFEQVDGISSSNNVFLTLRDTNRDGMQAGIAAGVASGLAAAFGSGLFVMKGNSEALFSGHFDAILINQTDKGLGFIPMHSSKVVMTTAKIENLEPALDEYVFAPYEVLADIKAKNYSFLNKKIQTVKIKFGDKYTLHLLARKQEKLLPYQEENYAKFMAQYDKK